jgi:hypothetical protein
VPLPLAFILPAPQPVRKLRLRYTF